MEVHNYKAFDSSDVLKLIPKDDVVAYYGMYYLMSDYGLEECLNLICDEDIAEYLEKQGYKIEKLEERCEN